MARKRRKGKKRKEDKKRKKRRQRALRGRSRRRNTRTDRGSSRRKKSKRRDRSRNTRTDRGNSRKKKSGSKKTRREGRRIIGELQDRERKGNRKARKLRKTKIERRPKNIGRRGERGEKERKAAQERQNKLIASQVNKALAKEELVNARRFGPLEDQYKAAMEKLGDVSGINAQLQASIDEMKLSNARDLEAFQNEQTLNANLINTMESNANAQIAAMETKAAEDRKLYQASLNSLESQYTAQNALAQEQARIQAVQAKKAQNLATAYVPGREDSLATVTYGDQRTKSKRKAKDNRLSDLRLNTGLKPASAGASTAGLQLA